MKNYLTIIIASFFVFACSQKVEKNWQYEKTIDLGESTPVGLVVDETGIYYSDSQGNRIVKIDENGKEFQVFDKFERPMHIYKKGDEIFIPEFAESRVTILNVKTGNKEKLQISNGIETPASIFKEGSNTAIVDFNYHRIILQTPKGEIIIGEQGHNFNQLYYPTDVAINNDTLYVADAYNHRIQVFDLLGNYLKSMAYKDSINTLTGLEITKSQIIVGDYENNRVIIYNRQGKKQQVIKGSLSKPIEVSVYKNKMYVANFEGKSISIFNLK